jgi:alkylated DNA repair dioxygenase AlkB
MGGEETTTTTQDPAGPSSPKMGELGKGKEKEEHTVIPTRGGDEDVKVENLTPKIWSCEEKETKGLGAGDSSFVRDFLSKEEVEDMFKTLSSGEIEFQQWYHMPYKNKPLRPLRRVKVAMATEADEEGRVPHYRFPVNNQDAHGVVSPMTPTVEAFRQKVEEYTGIHYNHAVVLLYRDGEDAIGYHKDKLLDLDEEAPIVSCSLGQARWYHLRDDIYHPTVEERLILQPGGLMLLGPKTNKNYYHSVPKVEDEKAVVGPRISITFRRTLTYRDDEGKISGKGEEFQTANWPEKLKGSHRTEKLDPLPSSEDGSPSASSSSNK